MYQNNSKYGQIGLCKQVEVQEELKHQTDNKTDTDR